ncbi:hypothetical protein C8F01DRAFT_1249477 [Mycena amicta]|nr:hypothetical protein C8F01DRAFT_1249477 [Mycena amicta]
MRTLIEWNGVWCGFLSVNIGLMLFDSCFREGDAAQRERTDMTGSLDEDTSMPSFAGFP